MNKMTAGRPSSDAKSKSLTDLKNEGKVRLNADVPKDLYKKVKIKALENEISVTQLVQDALNEYLSN